MCRFLRSVAAIACILSLSSAAVWVPRGARLVRTEDRNHDGRPDVWHFSEPNARSARVAIDSNFDGRSDEDRQYLDGALVRRDVDRNFDDRADLVEEFDIATRDVTRSIVDVDFDGDADLLLLRQDGRPVFEKRADPDRETTASARPPASSLDPDRDATGALAPVTDPFRADAAIRAPLPPADDTTSARVPAKSFLRASQGTSTSLSIQPAPGAPSDTRRTSILTLARHGRAPPAGSLLRS